MKISVCEKCKHFTQHYIHSEMFGFSDVRCGHCHKKLMKKKDCGCFEENFKTDKNEFSIAQYLHNCDRKIIHLSEQMGKLINSLYQFKNEVEKASKQ